MNMYSVVCARVVNIIDDDFPVVIAVDLSCPPVCSFIISSALRGRKLSKNLTHLIMTYGLELNIIRYMQQPWDTIRRKVSSV